MTCGWHFMIPYETRVDYALGGMVTTVTSVYCPKCGDVEEMGDHLMGDDE